ncbi:MAG TPA: glucosamine-6-phosphate deaminase, partial [Firmicutes bacterium]|nr:glucosamine-6-phosphate deaminase [Bacillota bacterium]
AADPELVLGLPSGNTPLGLYRRLQRAVQEGRCDLSRVTVFALDEYAGVAPADPHSFAYFLQQHLVSRMKLGCFHYLHGDAPDLAAECARYEELLQSAGGLDLVLLGLGLSGHVAFNEPGTAFTSRTHVARLAPLTRVVNTRYFSAAFTIPYYGLTLGLGTLLEARELVLLASGAEKASQVAQLLATPPGPELPATILKLHPNALLLLDKAAAGHLAG